MTYNVFGVTLNPAQPSINLIIDHFNNDFHPLIVAALANVFKEGTPEMFTSREFDSTVYIRPRMLKEPTPCDDLEETLCLTGLPYEMLVRVASFLDSFSLCNLSLTCWLLRDVCRSLLRQRGLVVLEWQKDCSRNPPRWKVSHQVSLSVWVYCSSAIIEETLRVAFSLIVLYLVVFITYLVCYIIVFLVISIECL